MSDEMQESNNKLIKIYREGFSRKYNRTKMMEDAFLQLLITPDPLISSLFKLYKLQNEEIM